MYILRDYQERVDRFICSRSRPAFIIAWVLVTAGLALEAAVFLWMGAPPLNGLARDTPMFLDGGWRILNGQIPHKDFFVYFGDLPLYIASLGMKLGRPGVSSITCGNVFVLLATGLATMAILRRRASAFYACLFSLFLALLAVTPRVLGDGHDFTCYAMIYNRYGEAVLSLLGALLFLPLDFSLKESWVDWLETLFAGFLLSLLLFCKLNYFAVGIGFFTLACLRGRFTFPRAFAVVLSTAAFIDVALALTGIPLSAMLGDYRIMLGAPAQRLSYRLPSLAYQAAKGALLFAVLLLMVWEISRKENDPRKSRSLLILVMAIFGGELCLVASNSQNGELPLLALAALYGAELIRRHARDLAEGRFFITVRNSGAALLFLFFLLPTFATDLKTMRYCIRATMEKLYVTSHTLRSTRLNDFRIAYPGSEQMEMQNLMANFDEGIDLLRRHPDPHMRLACFLVSNPYHVALGLVPAKGGVICWSWTGISKESHPPLQRMVGNATHILTGYMRGDYVDAGFGIMSCSAPYGAEWDALHLEVVERTKNFTLFKVPEEKQTKLSGRIDPCPD